jgi:HD-GYP domain-containing protein (c-di-GMP phosphodiesterase class II)
MPRAWLFSRSLLYPLTAVLVALAVLPVGLVGWGFYTSNREQVMTLEKLYLTRQSVGLAKEFEYFFLDTVGRIDTMAKSMRPSANKPLDVGGASTTLEEVVRGHSAILMLRMLDGNGQGPAVRDASFSSTTETAVDEVLAEAFAANMKGRPVRKDLLRLPGEKPLMVISLPLTGVRGTPEGSLQGVVSLEEIGNRVAEERASGVTVDVVDREGAVLFSSDRTRVGAVATHHPLVKQFLDAAVRVTTVYHDPLRPDNAEVLGSVCPIGNVPWGVVTARESGVAFAAAREMAQRTALLAAVTGLLAMGASVLLARRITSPMRHLADVSTGIAQGDFAARVPVTSRNEIGQLAANFNSMAHEVERYVDSLRRALRENQELMVDSIRALAAAIDAKNQYTRGHSERVSQYAVAIARHCGLRTEEVKSVEISALLHDVGKIGIDDAILTKPDALTESEFAQMRIHPIKGAAIVSPIKRLREMLPGIRSHHENWGGGGYPDGLVGEQIPLIARIIAAADVFDAMTTQRPYQAAMGLDYVHRRMRELSGHRLDPAVVEAFFVAVRSGDLVPLGEAEVA